MSCDSPIRGDELPMRPGILVSLPRYKGPGSGYPLRAPYHKTWGAMNCSLHFTECKAAEAPQYNILTSIGDYLTYEITHSDCLVLHPGLQHQYLLTQYLLELV